MKTKRLLLLIALSTVLAGTPLFSQGLPMPAVGNQAHGGGGFGGTLVAHTGCGLGANGGSTLSGTCTNGTSLTTTGASCIVLHVAYSTGGTGLTITDLQGGMSNTYIALTAHSNSGGAITDLFYYSVPTHVGAAHSWSVTGTSIFASMEIQAWSGVTCTPQSMSDLGADGSGGNTDTSQMPGSESPSASYLVPTGIQTAGDQGSGGFSIDSSFTISDYVRFAGGSYYGSAMAYRGTSSTVNPTWSWGTGDYNTSSIVVMH